LSFCIASRVFFVTRFLCGACLNGVLVGDDDSGPLTPDDWDLECESPQPSEKEAYL
jgi:hypothetical protein